MSDEELRAAYQRAVAGGSVRPDPAECPPPDALRALVERQGSDSGRRALLDHVMACERCRPELDLLRTLQQAGGEAGTARRPAWRRFAPYALAASLVGAIGVGIAVQPDRPDRDVTRGGPAAALALVAPAPGAPVAEPVTLVWRSAAGARRYTVEVIGADGMVVYAAAATDTALQVPEGVLEPGTEYRWWVRTGGGVGQRRSAAGRFLLRED